MTTPRFIPASLTLAAAGVAVFFAGAASAGQACNTPDAPACPTGFQCEVVGGTGCAEPACAPGQTCPPPPPCNTTTFSECMPGPCTTDADCGTGMVCYAQTETACPATGAPSCAPDQVCPPPPPPEPCTTTTKKSCVPRYAVPCQLDVNCGDGFTCVPDQECTCTGGSGVGFAMDGGAAPGSGSGSSGSAGGASTPPPAPNPSGTGGSSGIPTPTPIPDPACSCTTLATSHCVAKQVVCNTVSDCPSQWTCEPMAISNVTTCVGAAPSPMDGGVAPPPVCDPLPQPPSVSYCMPPYADLVRGTAAGEALGTSTSGSAGQAGAGGTVIPPSAGVGGSTGNGAPTGTAGTAGSTDSAGAAAPSASNDSGGCQVGAGRSSTSGAALLGVLGFLGLARRRRSRAA